MAEKKLLMDEYILTTSEQALKNIQNSYKLTKELVIYICKATVNLFVLWHLALVVMVRRPQKIL